MATGNETTITNDELVQFRRAAQQYINSHAARTPLHHALERSLKQTKAAFEDFADDENEIRVDCALIDEKTKQFILNDKELAIDSTKAKDLQKRTRALGRKEVKVTLYQATEVPPKIEAVWIQQFAGLVIDMDYVSPEEELAELEEK